MLVLISKGYLVNVPPNELAEGVKRRRLFTVSLRPAAIFGEKEKRHLPRIAQYIEDGLFTFTIGDPSNKVDWVYVDNLVDAFLLAALSLGSDFTAGKPPKASGNHIHTSHPLEAKLYRVEGA